MPIASGAFAPTFTARTHTGDAIDLSSFRGQKVWLGFYRWAACPLCNLRIREVIERYPEFDEAGIKVLAVFQSPPETIAQYVGAQNPPFPLIADPDLQLYEQYGVHSSVFGMFYPRVFLRAFQAMMGGLLNLHLGDGPRARIPADFLVDPEGLVWKAYYGSAISDHIPFDDVRSFATDLCLEMPQPGGAVAT